MTLQRKIRTAKNNFLEINTDDQDIINHFQNGHNFADVVLNQINNDTLYDRVLKDKDDLVILDIGANIGLFSLHAQQSAKNIYALEPTPSHFKKLKELTKEYSNIQPLEIALNDRDEEISFYMSDHNSTMNSSVNQYGRETKVQGRTLLSVIKELGLSHVDFIKCDIEGSEMRALNEKSISEVKDLVDEWFVEAHATNLSTEMNRDILAGIFIRNNYDVEYYGSDTLYVSRKR